MSRTDDRRSAISIPSGPLAGDVIEVEITALAAGGAGVARDAGGRVTFVPRTAPGDRVRARNVKTTSSLAHAELLEVISPSEMRVDALVPLAPYLAMPPFVRGMARTSRAWGWLLPYFSSLGTRSIRDPAAAERALGHGILTPAALRALYDVVNDAVRALPHVTAPALVVQSREDNRIQPEPAEREFARLGSAQKKFIWTDGAAHVITVDFGHQRVFEMTTDWLEAHLHAIS